MVSVDYNAVPSRLVVDVGHFLPNQRRRYFFFVSLLAELGEGGETILREFA